MNLVRAHCDLARRDSAYTFVLAEVDYLKPYWDAFPEERAFLRELLRTGRVEIMGGTYNEPNTNLTGAEATIRNAVYGDGFQRGIIGYLTGDGVAAGRVRPRSAVPRSDGRRGAVLQLVGARPLPPVGSHALRVRRGAPGSEPDAVPRRVLLDRPLGARAADRVHGQPLRRGLGHRQRSDAARGPAGRSQALQGAQAGGAHAQRAAPGGGDYAPPCRWVMGIHRDWNARYVWPRFVSAVPRDFFAAVRAELDAEGRKASPQTRDMNPVYTGKDVSYIDTKQAQRHGETLLADAEAWATLACLVTGHPYPDAALDKAWRQLIYGAKHDAITGSESDQVYIDLLTGWRELATSPRPCTPTRPTPWPGTSSPPGGGPDLVVFNSATWQRQDVLAVADPELVPLDDTGLPLPAVRENGELRVVVPEVPAWGSGAPARGRRGLRVDAGRRDHDPQRVLRADRRCGARRRRQSAADARAGRPGPAARRRHRQRAGRAGGVSAAPPLR